MLPRNTSALQGAGWIAEIMTTPHPRWFFDNIRMTKPCFYALVDALTSRGLLPHGQTSRDCVGAIDGTLVPAWVPRVDQNRYRLRKGRLAQNVLAICDFDMNFTYVYAGWEGSAADALSRRSVSSGKYYLVDASFTNYQCFLAPYRGTRYHLPEWRGQGRRYRTPQDMFNHAHSRLQNVIERAFEILKKHFSILQWGMPSYLLNHQVDIVIACCTLHNFIRRFSNDDIIFNEPDGDLPQDMDSFYHRGHPTLSEIEEQRTLRDSIAMQMWHPKMGRMAYRRYLESVGFPQEDHWTLNVEQQFMWMIIDDNTRMSIRDDEIAEAQMGHWPRILRRHFGYSYTRDQIHQKFFEFKGRLLVFHALTEIPGIQYDIETLAMVFPDRLRPYATRLYPLARRYFQYLEPLYPSMLEVWDPIRQPAAPAQGHDDVYDVRNHHATPTLVRGGPYAPIVLSDSTVPLEQSHTHIASWDAVENVARGDGRPRLSRSRTVADRRSLDRGSEVGGIGSWTDYIRYFGVQSYQGGHTNSEGDSTARSRRPHGLPPPRRDGP
ncbi:UNVERIFIED_CONTAM: hypothetical protein Slati_1413600 [Sesamum latifolium]|uniref:DDE Tnp4 domain-containing protein n=1 Tax=Sesamum latifolium TaxID=2727402 RepID=A0AAW2X2X5_9LAMI